MARLGDVVKIEASSKQVVDDRFWLLNLDMDRMTARMRYKQSATQT